MPSADILIVGAGIVGMSLALELRARGARVTLVERADAGTRSPGIASWAAAGMIAAEDPYHPASLRELSLWSAGLYDGYLERIERVGGGAVRYQTESTRQILPDGSAVELRERSVNPRELFVALRAAVATEIVGGFSVREVVEEAEGVVVRSEAGSELRANTVVWANGAWMAPWTRPVKGQMMRVRLQTPTVVRAEHVYVVPRTLGEQAGTALVGATVEDAGFDLSVGETSLRELTLRAAELVPEVLGAEVVESWVGFRPATLNGLPVMSALRERQFVSGGHFRNGILLAPGSAVVVADLVEGKTPALDVEAFRVAMA